MGVLLSLSSAARAELAAAWGTSPETSSLFRAMTDSATIAEATAACDLAGPAVLRAAAEAPGTVTDLAARLPLATSTVERVAVELARRGLLVRVGPGATTRLARSPLGRARLVVPREIAALQTGQLEPC